MPRNTHPTGGTREVTASSRRDDRSGLIDIRALSSLVDAQRSPPAASASSLALPSFSTRWTLHEAPPRPVPPPVRRHAAPVEDNRPLYLMIGALTLAVLGLGAIAVLKTPRTVVVETVAPAPAASDEAVAADEARAEPEEQAEPEAVAAVEAAPAEAGAEVGGAAEADAAVEARAPTRARSRSRSRDHTPTRQPTTAKEPKQGGVVPVACVIDPASCDGKVTPGPRPPKADRKGLPESLSSTQIRNAIAKVKPQAKACGSQHGGHAGDKVKVKLSVRGEDGKVLSARPLDEHAKTALGRCVADAMAKATLPRFAKPQAGFVYSIRL